MLFLGVLLVFTFSVKLSYTSSELAGAQCGRTIKDSKGNFTFNNDTFESCTWTFSGPIKTGIYFRIENLALGKDANLTFYNGGVQQEQIVRFQGTHAPVLVISAANNSVIQFDGLNTTGISQFTIEYDTNQETGCQQTFTRADIFQSPYYPKAQVPVTCGYHLSTPDAATHLALTFDSLTFSTKARISVYDGTNSSSPKIATFTNMKTLPSDVISSGDSLFVTFAFSMASSPHEVFSAGYTSVNPECSGTVMVKEPRTWSSPGYPASYPANLDCRVVLEAPKGMRLLVTVTDLQLADEFDQITAFDGGNRYGYELASASGKIALEDSVVTTRGNKMWVRFSTDETGSAKGFSVIVEPRSVGGIFENMGRLMYNSSAPAFEYGTQNIVYMLIAKPDEQVKVNIDEDLWLVPAVSINFYDGSSTTDQRLAMIRSSSAFQKDVVASGNKMLVVVSNIVGSAPSQHYSFSFKGVRKGLFHNSVGPSDTFNLRLKGSDKEAMWFILADAGAAGVIALNFGSGMLMDKASIVIERGFQSYNTKIAVFDSSMDYLPTIYIPAYEGARVTFSSGTNSSDDTLADTTVLFLTAAYTTVPECQLEYTSNNGRIKSPLYPNQYPLNAACKWTITPPQHKMVHLAFKTFSLAEQHSLHMSSESSHQSHHGNKTVTNTTETDLGTYQGTTVPNDVVSADNHVFLDFTTKQGTQTSKGFVAEYEMIDCGGNITDRKAEAVETPGYPKPLSKATTCAWVITVPPGSNTSVNIITFKVVLQHYVKENSTRSNKLEIRDGGSFLSDVVKLDLQKEKSAYTTKPILTHLNTLWVRYSYNPSQKDAPTPGFAFKLDFDIHACPKAKQCSNGICMHDDWRCNGHDDCGDGSDEKGCTYEPTAQKITPLALGLSIVAVFCLAIAIACLAPYVYKRCRYPGYREFRDMMAPVPT